MAMQSSTAFAAPSTAAADTAPPRPFTIANTVPTITVQAQNHPRNMCNPPIHRQYMLKLEEISCLKRQNVFHATKLV
jgi:hypothetical protein